jgi:hypothetical protein
MRKGGRPTHRRGVGEHNERPEVVVAVSPGLEADGAPRPRGRVFPREAVVQQPRTRQRRRVGRFAHLVDTELPLHEGDDPPVVEVGPKPRPTRRPPGPSTRSGVTPAAPGAKRETRRDVRSRPSPSAPCRCRGEAGPIVAEVEPPLSHSALLDVIVQGM